MPNASGFLSRLLPTPKITGPNSGALNTAIRAWATATRKTRNATNVFNKNALLLANPGEVKALHGAIMNYLMAYNKANYKVSQAQAEPNAGNVKGAESALEAAAGAANKAASVAENVSGKIDRRVALLAEAATPEVQRQRPANQQSLTGNERRNLLKNLTNENTANNTMVANVARRILKINPNSKWANVNANGLTNGQRKVLNALKQAQASSQAPRQAPPPPPPPPRGPLRIRAAVLGAERGLQTAVGRMQEQLKARPAPPPPPPPMPTPNQLAASAARLGAQKGAARAAGEPAKVTAAGKLPLPPPTHREALLGAIAGRLFFTGNKTANGRNVYAASSNSKNYYAKKNNGTGNYYRVKKNGNAYNFNTQNNKAYTYVKGQGFQVKN